MISQNSTLSDSYQYCRRIAIRHYENFPVGSLLLPKNLRPHFFALYGFMRSADDFADLPHREKDERLALLAQWRYKLDHAISGKESDDPIFIALSNTIKECNLSPSPFYRLMEAFEFDARGIVHFETFDDLRWYTSRSAEPVGELVLELFGYTDEKRIRLSNEICTALQLLNFIQDIKEDIANNRYYFPFEDCNIFGSEIDGQTSIPLDKLKSLSLVSLFELERVESLLDRGAPLAESVSGRLRYELRAVIRAAKEMIKKIRKDGGNSYLIRPKLSKWEHLIVLLQSIVFRTR